MTKTSTFSLYSQCLIIGVIFSAFAFPIVAISQTAETSGGPKFVGVGETNSFFKQVSNLYVDPCDYISHDIKFCREGTDWSLEREPISNEQALYQLSEDRRASITVVWMKEDVSSSLSPAEIESLLNQHVYQDGPRGSFTIETIISEKTTSGGELIQRTAIVRHVGGKRHLQQITIFTVDYGVGFLETTLALSDTFEASEISDAQFVLHQEVLSLIRVSIGLGPQPRLGAKF